MEILDSIEKRIERLSRIVGVTEQEEKQNAESLTDSLVSANTLVNSALSGRDNITTIVNRTNELEHYLDPNFLDNQQEIKTKEVYINTVAGDLAESFETLENIKNLESTLGAEYFRSIPDVTDKLKGMNDIVSQVRADNELAEETLTLVMQRYDEIQNGLMDSIKTMNERLARMEEKLQTNKQPDEDI